MSVYFSHPRNASIAASSKMSVESECLLATPLLSASCGGRFWWALSSHHSPQAQKRV